MAKTQVYQAFFHGVSGILCERAQNSTKYGKKVPPEHKLYFADDQKTLVLPINNVSKTLFGRGACGVRLEYDNRKAKSVGLVVQNYVNFKPLPEHAGIKYGGGSFAIPVLKNGEPIEFGWKWNKDVDPVVDEASGVFLNSRSIPNPDGTRGDLTISPVIPAPWDMGFLVEYEPNATFDETSLEQMFHIAGRAVGVGQWRTGGHGRFVFEWQRV